MHARGSLSGDEHRILEAELENIVAVSRYVPRQLVLLAARGPRNNQIAERLNTRREFVRKWRKRFFEQRLEGLEERDRSGRSRFFPPELVIAVKAIACELPAQLRLPLYRLQVPNIRPRSSTAASWPASPVPPSGNGCEGRHPAVAPSELDLPPRPDLAPRPFGSSSLRPRV